MLAEYTLTIHTHVITVSSEICVDGKSNLCAVVAAAMPYLYVIFEKRKRESNRNANEGASERNGGMVCIITLFMDSLLDYSLHAEFS